MMTPIKVVLYIIVSLYYIADVDSSRILAVLPTNTRSHYAMYERILAGLASRNHELTVISHFTMKNHPDNVEEISLAGTIPEITNNLTIRTSRQANFVKNINQIMIECVQACDVLAESQTVKALLNSTQTFDLVIVEVFGSECALGFANRFDTPVVGLLSSVPLPWVNIQIGNPEATSYVPSYMLGYGQVMNFYERFINTFAVWWANIAYYYYSQIPSQIIAEKLFGDIPKLYKLAKNYSLILSNSHFSINDVRPIVPSLIEVGGLHIDEKQQLTPEIDKLLNSSTYGVIYWSFGSISRIDSIPIYLLQEMLNVFERMPYTVIVKMDLIKLNKNITIPKNVIARSWMPQYKTLCHSNVKLFISHGGLLGIQESVMCGIPMLIIPLFADQALNGRAMSDRGLAKVLQFEHINSVSWEDSINEILNNSEYKTRALEQSFIFQDRPMKPLDTSIYWIEYVLRHKGAKHLRSPSLDLHAHQYLLLDVIFIFICIVLIMLSLVYMIVNRFIKLFVNLGTLDKSSGIVSRLYIITVQSLRQLYKYKVN